MIWGIFNTKGNFLDENKHFYDAEGKILNKKRDFLKIKGALFNHGSKTCVSDKPVIGLISTN